MGPETDEMVQFLDPETTRKLLFLGPEIVKMVQQYFWTKKLTKWFSFLPQKELFKYSILFKYVAVEAMGSQHNKNMANVV